MNQLQQKRQYLESVWAATGSISHNQLNELEMLDSRQHASVAHSHEEYVALIQEWYELYYALFLAYWLPRVVDHVTHESQEVV